MPIGAGIDDGYNDYFNQTTDIIPDDITSGYADPYEENLSDNFTYGPLTLSGTGGNTAASDVPVVGATQPALLITPSEATIQEGATQQYTDQYYPNGESQGDPQDVTTQSLWSDGGSAVASIGANTGLATGTAAGTATVTASYTPPGGSALSNTAGLAVQQQQPAVRQWHGNTNLPGLQPGEYTDPVRPAGRRDAQTGAEYCALDGLGDGHSCCVTTADSDEYPAGRQFHRVH